MLEEEIKPYNPLKYSEDEDCYRQIERLNNKLVDAERSKTRFLSLLRNEFDNPLISIVSMLRELSKSASANAEESEMIGLAYMDSLKLSFQLTNILAVASVETGVLEKNITTFYLSSMLNDIDHSLSHIFQTKNLQVCRNIRCSEEITNDRDKVYSILLNLIANAYEYSEHGSEVIIEISEEENLLSFSIKNRGDKIQDPQAIFDAFYQQKQGYARSHQGLGIGLSIVGAYIDFLGGSILVSRENDCNTFLATIPLFSQSSEQFGNEFDSFLFD